MFKVLTCILILFTEPVVKGFFHVTSPLNGSDRALTLAHVYLDPRFLTPEDETFIDGISPNVFDVFLASVSHIQVAGLSLRSFRSLPVPIILESTML